MSIRRTPMWFLIFWLRLTLKTRAEGFAMHQTRHTRNWGFSGNIPSLLVSTPSRSSSSGTDGWRMILFGEIAGLWDSYGDIYILSWWASLSHRSRWMAVRPNEIHPVRQCQLPFRETGSTMWCWSQKRVETTGWEYIKFNSSDPLFKVLNKAVDCPTLSR